MEILNAVLTATVIAVVGWLVVQSTKGRVDDLGAQMDRRFDDVDRRFDAVERRFETVDKRFDAVDRRFDSVDRRFERVEASIDGLRSDLTQVALAVGVRPRAGNG
jgi:chaperonin cofactor prefoldin